MTPTQRAHVALAIAAAAVTSACAGGSSSGSATASASSPTAPAATMDARVVAPAGVALTSACTPSGPELCFNAMDDNCNGVIDEGCGVNTGPLQFTIAWGDSPADVDLVVTGPAGERVDHANRSTSSGLHLDRDCPNEGCSGQNIENGFFDGMEPPRGRYAVDVKLKKLHGATTPVRVRFGARVGARSYGADVPLVLADEKKTFTFEL